MTKDPVIKNIVREVVREELQSATQKIIQEVSQKQEDIYAKYRDDVLTKLDKAIGELKKHNEEDAAHQMQHNDLEERVHTLEQHIDVG